MTPGTSLVLARAPLYSHFLGIFALVLSAARPLRSASLKGLALTWASRLAILAALLRRWVRCQRGLPSRLCCSVEGRPLEPNVDGMHRRFLELYDGPRADEEPGVSLEDRLSKLQRRVTLEDGQTIAYWDVGPPDARTTVVLCNGLGVRISCWVPLLDALHGLWDQWRRCRLIIPEYRGQFSSAPLVGQGVSVERSAADLAALAATLGLEQCSLLCWSTGVQVGLQLALDKPQLVRSMVLIQGTTGEALDCILQPLCTVPGMPGMLSLTLRMAPRVLLQNGRRGMIYERMVRHTAALECGGRCALWFFGSDLIPSTAVRYVQDMIQTDAHFSNYCGYAQALGRHVLCRYLPEIKAPALIVTGTPDFVTPARCSYDMAALLGGEAELFDDISGSHYYLFEEPHKLARRVITFMERASFVGGEPDKSANGRADSGQPASLRSRK